MAEYRISKDEFNSWWSSPCAIEFKKMMKEDLDKLAWGTMIQSFARDHIGNAIEVGRFMAILHYYKITYEALIGEEE